MNELLELRTLLLAQQLKIATAESCTGGLLSQHLTSIAGASAWFDCGIISYSNEAKQNILQVKKNTIDCYGAVSKQCALEMVQGLLNLSPADWGIAITGIAGPTGNTPDKPIGLVHFALGNQKKEWFSYEKIFTGNRQEIQEQACLFSLNQLIVLLNNSEEKKC